MAARDVAFSITAQDKTSAAFNSVKAGITTLGRSITSLNGAFSGVRSGINAIGNQIFSLKSAFAGLVGVAGLSVMAKSAMDTADKIHKLNIRLGASTEALSQYRHVATLSGVSFETFTMGLQRMTRRVSEAAGGAGEAKDALAELGMDAQVLATLAPEDQFETLADALAKIEDPATKVRLAMKLFDSEGVALLQMMTGGADGLRQMRDEADSLGMTMSKEMVTSVADANDALAKIREQIMGVVEAVVGAASPAITNIANGIRAWIGANQEMIGQNIMAVIQGITFAIDALSPVVAQLAGDFGDFLASNQEIIAANISAVFERLLATGQALAPVFVWVKEVFYGVADALARIAAQVMSVIDRLKNLSASDMLKKIGSLTADWGSNFISGMSDANYTGPHALGYAATTGTAAQLAASGGGAGFTGSDAELWNWEGSGSGTTVVNNFNTSISRSDAVAIAAESARVTARQ